MPSPAIASRVIVATGTIPFEVLSLPGRPLDRLPGWPWESVYEPPAGRDGLARHVHRAWGTADGRPIAINVLVRSYGGRVWAVGVHADDFLFGVQASPEGDRHWLAATPRPAGVASNLVNWIAKEGDRPVEIGLSP